ncbi:HU family DNA-binding protein (plasmid) [Deinococcus sp. KNUC1210]|uniref:HU family DNA-binding protein n=1 Tax=Deinococcus sp. KNUC1210 TaxID=2917691 RepID=UPI001EF133C6|nr:HU family DNA-binding protein [Deinococcus sp. KNUC1210]ULH18057.1 HU family DNA-binding protein [Deinococcus sp. KNUC1210]
MTKKSAAKTTAKTAPATPAPVEAAVIDKLTKLQLIDQVALRTNMTKREAGLAVDAALEAIVEALKSGKSVGLTGLGTLDVRATAARTGVRPGTAEKIQIPAGKKVGFKVATDLKKAL